jgi:threonine synthase
VAAAFHGRPGVEVAVLYPAGMVSPRQEKQLTAWGGNVRAFAVRGAFDDCQRLVKAAMADPELRASRRLSSANSINVGRLLPQMAYYAWSAREYVRRHGVEPGFIIPSGNLGNAAAALWARTVGVPVREVVLATNANPAITAFTGGAGWCAHPTVSTLATAMDVGSPSNMERVLHLFGGEEVARGALRAERVDDGEIRRVIAEGMETWGEVWDPHTATAVAVRERIGGGDWIIVSTAHPAKFEGVVEPLVGHPVPIPPELQRILLQPSHAEPLEPTLDALRDALGRSAER